MNSSLEGGFRVINDGELKNRAAYQLFIKDNVLSKNDDSISIQKFKQKFKTAFQDRKDIPAMEIQWATKNQYETNGTTSPKKTVDEVRIAVNKLVYNVDNDNTNYFVTQVDEEIKKINTYKPPLPPTPIQSVGDVVEENSNETFSPSAETILSSTIPQLNLKAETQTETVTAKKSPIENVALSANIQTESVPLTTFQNAPTSTTFQNAPTSTTFQNAFTIVSSVAGTALTVANTALNAAGSAASAASGFVTGFNTAIGNVTQLQNETFKYNDKQNLEIAVIRCYTSFNQENRLFNKLVFDSNIDVYEQDFICQFLTIFTHFYKIDLDVWLDKNKNYNMDPMYKFKLEGQKLKSWNNAFSKTLIEMAKVQFTIDQSYNAEGRMLSNMSTLRERDSYHDRVVKKTIQDYNRIVSTPFKDLVKEK